MFECGKQEIDFNGNGGSKQISDGQIILTLDQPVLESTSFSALHAFYSPEIRAYSVASKSIYTLISYESSGTADGIRSDLVVTYDADYDSTYPRVDIYFYDVSGSYLGCWSGNYTDEGELVRNDFSRPGT